MDANTFIEISVASALRGHGSACIIPHYAIDPVPNSLWHIRLLKAEAAEAVLSGRAMSTLRQNDSDSLRTTHHKLILLAAGFRGKDRNGYKTLRHKAVRKMIECEHIEMTIRNHRPRLAGGLVYEGKTRRPKRIMFGRLAAEEPKEAA